MKLDIRGLRNIIRGVIKEAIEARGANHLAGAVDEILCNLGVEDVVGATMEGDRIRIEGRNGAVEFIDDIIIDDIKIDSAYTGLDNLNLDDVYEYIKGNIQRRS